MKELVFKTKGFALGWLFFFSLTALHAQIYFTRDAQVSFHSDAPLEKIEAHNQNGSSVIDLTNGSMEFAVLIKAFQFKKALMQEHFNENYLESDVYPKATFKGKFTGFSQDDLDSEQSFSVDVNGILTIHGESKEISTKGMFKPAPDSIIANASFTVMVADYKIEIPGIVRDKIAKEVRIDIELVYRPLNNN